MMTLNVRAIPCLSDNYAWLLTCTDTGTVAVCDPGEAAPVLAALPGGRCDLVLITHHHGDHVGGVASLVAATGAKTVGHPAPGVTLPPLDHALDPGEGIALGASRAIVIATPGHARGHIAFHIQAPGRERDVLLSGDALFSLGCGKLLEGTAEEMFLSLQRLRTLAPDTLVCPGHEYTLSNARFALTVEPDNQALRDRVREAEAQRAAGEPTVPTTIAEEIATNPFLRAPDVATLAARRRAKDSFRG